MSGTIPLEERPDGARLLTDAKAGVFNAVVVYRVDRLARSLRVLLDGHNKLEAVGVAIKSATEPFDSSTPLGKFLFQLLGSMAELESATILERMTLGRDRVARQGRWTSGVLPFGYTLDAQHCLIPSQRLVDGLGMTEAEVARDIFHRMAAGSTTNKECQRLTALGVPHARRYRNGTEATVSSGWAPTRRTRMIWNSVYVGRHRFHSRHGVIERPVPALVDEQAWERAKAQLLKNRHLPKNGTQRSYLLRGLIQCVHCGSYYTGSTKERIPGQPSFFYRCGGRVSKRYPHMRENCPGRQLKAAWLEDFVWDQCRAFILNPGQALEEAQHQLQTRMGHGARLEKERERLCHALAEQASGRDGVLTLFRRGRIALAEAETQLDALAKEDADIRAHLTALESQQHLAAALESHLTEASLVLTQLQTKLQAIEASNDQDAKRQVIAFLVAHIDVETDATVRPKQATATVTFRFSEQGAAHIPLFAGVIRMGQGRDEMQAGDMSDRRLCLVRHAIYPVGAGESRHVRQAGKTSRLDYIWLNDIYPGLDQTLDALESVFLFPCCHGNVQRPSKLGKAVGMLVLHRLLEPHIAQVFQRTTHV